MTGQTTAELQNILKACDEALWVRYPTGERVKRICIEEGAVERMRLLMPTETTPCPHCGTLMLPCADGNGVVCPRHCAEKIAERQTTDLQVNPLIDFADRWQLDGDYIRCKHCQRPQQISWLHHDFPHRAWCHNIGKDMNPWKTLVGLITAETAKARVPS